MFSPYSSMTDDQLKAEIDALLTKPSQSYSNNDVAVVIGSLVNYLSYRQQEKLAKLQEDVVKQTTESIKWSRRLVWATGALAAGTFVLALITLVR